jgi:hypothetical protein
MIRKLTEAECKAAIEKGDFDASLVEGPSAAIILTQSWCPQWAAMKGCLKQIEEEMPNTPIYYVEYDIERWESLDNQAFMNFKENTFNNREIPYVRFYRNGVFYRDSNYISAGGFKERLG